MSDQLKADLGHISDLSSMLSRLSGELSETPHQLDEYSSAMGDAALAQVTQALGEDWTTFRQRLIEDIGTLGTFAETAARQYAGVDSDLASSIAKLMPPQPSSHMRAYAD
ncbi:hypothetical protein GCM10009839_64510 [Catenulispora yoronensis]|uniref:WXG100 family type VII secretion target n=1 Tax=Catenulispora yoronensis TaxID=450799 RepID=A0ABN2V3V1_9ACTN